MNLVRSLSALSNLGVSSALCVLLAGLWPGSSLAAPCKDGFEMLGCTRAVDNDGGKLPALPEVGAAVTFKALATRATRITAGGMFDGDDARQRHQYSRRQAWNADETLLDLGGGIIDAEDYSVVLSPVPVSSARNWSNLDPELIYGIRYNPDPNEFGIFNVRSGEFESVQRFADFESCSIGEGEGNLSNDDQRVVFVCTKDAAKADSGADADAGADAGADADAGAGAGAGAGADAGTGAEGDDPARVMIAYDIGERRELGRRTARVDMNWVSFTQSGRHVVVENNLPGHEDSTGIVRFEPDFSARKVLTVDRSHGDLGIDQQGNDVLAMIDWKRLSYIDIASGRRTRLGIADRLKPVGHGHVSCRNIHRPGWCYLSSFDGAIGAFRLGASSSWLDRARHLLSRESGSKAGVAAFEPWGFHFSSSNDYDAQPKASVSPSGRQVIFTTDWNGSGELNDFVLTPVQ